MILVLTILFWLSFTILFYCYVGYGLIVFLLQGLKKTDREQRPVNENLLPVTLVITAFNESEILSKKIQNLLDLDYPKDLLKVIIAVDGPFDNPETMFSDFSFIHVLHEPVRKGKYAAIKRAMKFVDTPIVIFSDANTMINREAIKKIVPHFSDPVTGGVAGEKKIIVNKHTSAVGQGEGLYWQYESLMKKLDARLYTVIGAAGELFSMRTELFKEFPDDLIIDDFVISMQICLQGYKIAYEPHAYAAELPSASLEEEEKRKIRISAGAYQSIGYLKDCLNFRQHPLLTFQFVSRRLLRWIFCPVMLLVFYTTNLFIVMINPISFFSSILLLQTTFYAMAFIGWLLIRHSYKAGIFTIPFYFLFMNVCLIKGFGRYLKGQQSVLWEKSLRQAL